MAGNHLRGIPRLYLVRHGQTRLNAAGLLRGHLDEPLDAVGRAQAGALGAFFAQRPLAAVMTSPLARAYGTAQPIAEAAALTVEVIPMLIDRDYGAWAGRPARELAAARARGDAGSIESNAAFPARVARCLAILTERARSGPVVAVSHDAVNRLALFRLLPGLAASPEAIPQRTGCWNELELRDGRWQAVQIDGLPGDGPHP